MGEVAADGLVTRNVGLEFKYGEPLLKVNCRISNTQVSQRGLIARCILGLSSREINYKSINLFQLSSAASEGAVVCNLSNSLECEGR